MRMLVLMLLVLVVVEPSSQISLYDTLLEAISKRLITYKDLFTDENLFSDSYKLELVDDIYYVVTEKQGSANTASDRSVIDLIFSSQLEKTEFTEREFKGYMQLYVNKLIEHLEANGNQERADFLYKNPMLNVMMRAILTDFDNWKIYFAKGDNADKYNKKGMAVFVNTDNNVPYAWFFKDGLYMVNT